MSECSNVLAEFLMKLSCDGNATSMSTNTTVLAISNNKVL